MNLQIFLLVILVAVANGDRVKIKMNPSYIRDARGADNYCHKETGHSSNIFGSVFDLRPCVGVIDFLKCWFTIAGYMDSETEVFDVAIFRENIAKNQGEEVEQQFWDFCYKDVDLPKPFDPIYLSKCLGDFFTIED